MDRARAAYPELWTAARNDLCFATTNRQAALQAIAAEADAIVVIGSANSSNTLALAKVATAAGCPTVLRIDGPDELDADALGDARVVGVTAGASAPEDLVQAVIARLAPSEGVVPVHVTDEDEYFPPPRELRELMTTLRRRRPGPVRRCGARRCAAARSPRTDGSTRPASSRADAAVSAPAARRRRSTAAARPAAPR